MSGLGKLLHDHVAKIFVAVGLAFGLIAALFNPFQRPPDEVSHLMRVEVIDRGYLVAPSVESNPSDYTLDGCDRALKIDSFKWMVLKTKEGLDKPFRRYRCVSPEPLIHGGERIAANTEINPPVAYVPAWIGYRAGRGIAGVPFDYLGARLASLMAYLALTYGALRVLPFGRVFLAIVALLPGNLFVAAAVSADPMTVGVGFLFVSLVVRAVVDAREPKPMPTRSLCILGAVGVALALCKPSSLPLVILPLAIPTGAFGSLRRRVRATAAVVRGPLLVVQKLCGLGLMVFGPVFSVFVGAEAAQG